MEGGCHEHVGVSRRGVYLTTAAFWGGSRRTTGERNAWAAPEETWLVQRADRIESLTV